MQIVDTFKKDYKDKRGSEEQLRDYVQNKINKENLKVVNVSMVHGHNDTEPPSWLIVFDDGK